MQILWLSQCIFYTLKYSFNVANNKPYIITCLDTSPNSHIQITRAEYFSVVWIWPLGNHHVEELERAENTSRWLWKMFQENILMEFFSLYLPANRITNKYMYLYCWVLKHCQFLYLMIDRSPTVHHLLLKSHVLQADIVSLYNFQHYGHYTSHITFMKTWRLWK